MLVREPVDVHVLQRNRRGLPDRDLQANPFIVDAAEAGSVQEPLGQIFGRCAHIIEQPDLAQFETACKMISQQIVFERFGGQFQESDLGRDLKPSRRIVHVLLRQSGLQQDRRDILAFLVQSGGGKPRYLAGGAWYRTESLGSVGAHPIATVPKNPAFCFAASKHKKMALNHKNIFSAFARRRATSAENI